MHRGCKLKSTSPHARSNPWLQYACRFNSICSSMRGLQTGMHVAIGGIGSVVLVRPAGFATVLATKLQTSYWSLSGRVGSTDSEARLRAVVPLEECRPHDRRQSDYRKLGFSRWEDVYQINGGGRTRDSIVTTWRDGVVGAN